MTLAALGVLRRIDMLVDTHIISAAHAPADWRQPVRLIFGDISIPAELSIYEGEIITYHTPCRPI